MVDELVELVVANKAINELVELVMANEAIDELAELAVADKAIDELNELVMADNAFDKLVDLWWLTRPLSLMRLMGRLGLIWPLLSMRPFVADAANKTNTADVVDNAFICCLRCCYGPLLPHKIFCNICRSEGILWNFWMQQSTVGNGFELLVLPQMSTPM